MSTEEVLDLVRRRQALPEPARRRLIREAAGLSQEELASAIGVATSTLCRWERGESRPNRDHLATYVRLLQALAREALT